VPFVVSDLVVAQSAIETGNANLNTAQWSGAAWERLGIVARLMGDNASADRFAQRAYQGGASLRDFSQVSARVFLNIGRPNDALVHADHFAEVTDGSPEARLLLARIFLAQERLGPADEIVSEIGPDAHLTPVEQLTLARVWLTLQRWDALAATMAAVKRVPETLEPERNFLQAVAQIQQERDLVVALSVLDYLAEELGRAPAKVTGPDAAARPTVYEVQTWRGVARMRGEQIASARQAFAEAIQERPDLPDAYYWNAELEVREGQYDAAQMLLQNALATSANYAPAWETLGWMALETGNIELALEDLHNAVVANPRRASAHFLVAHASAQLANREETAAALRAAFALDPSYVDKARTEVFLRLFSEAELEALAADAATAEGEGDQAE